MIGFVLLSLFELGFFLVLLGSTEGIFAEVFGIVPGLGFGPCFTMRSFWRRLGTVASVEVFCKLSLVRGWRVCWVYRNGPCSVFCVLAFMRLCAVMRCFGGTFFFVYVCSLVCVGARSSVCVLLECCVPYESSVALLIVNRFSW